MVRYLRQIFSFSNWSLLEDEFDALIDSLLESELLLLLFAP